MKCEFVSKVDRNKYYNRLEKVQIKMARYQKWHKNAEFYVQKSVNGEMVFDISKRNWKFVAELKYDDLIEHDELVRMYRGIIKEVIDENPSIADVCKK